jgi:hypothetical protein
MRCKECDSILWSLASKEAGVCTECREGEDTLSSMQIEEIEQTFQTYLTPKHTNHDH